MDGQKDCKFCDKKGLLWLPLRYSVVGSDDPDAFEGLPKIDGKKLGKGVVDIKLSDPKSKYAVRLLRPGYLYVLLDHMELRYWRAYQVLDDAYLYEFSADHPPQITPQFSCDPFLCGVNASMVSIPDPKNVEKIWTLFTHAPLTKAKLSEYKLNADAYALDGKMQTFSPAGWLSGKTDQSHSLLGPELLNVVAEYVLFTEPTKSPLFTKSLSGSKLGRALRDQMIPATANAYESAVPDGKGGYSGRLGALQALIKRKGYAAFVLYDHIGVTQELNDRRNDAFQPVDDFMKKTEGDGPNNRWKFDVHHQIDVWRTLTKEGLVTDALNSVERADFWRRVEREPIFRDDTKAMRLEKYIRSGNVPRPREYLTFPCREEWEAAHPKEVETFEQARQDDEDRYLEFAQKKAKNDWRDRYAPHLDEVEMDKFISKINGFTLTCKPEANRRAPQHLRWLKSSRLLHAFDVCDQDDPHSGEALQTNVFQCIFGMEGSAEAERVMTEWATATKITRENLLLRAFTRDQNGVKKEADKALADIIQKVNGTTEFSVMPATGWKTAIKGLVSAVKSSDSALDEWMRDQGQSKNFLNPKHIANAEARCLYFVSTITRSVARKGVGGKLDRALVACAHALLMPFLGDLSTKLEHDILNLRINPEKWEDIKRSYKDADARAKAVAERKTKQQKYMWRLAQRAKAKLENAGLDLILDAQCKAKLHIAEGAKSLGWGGVQTQFEESAKQHRNYKDAAKELSGRKIPAEKIPDVPSPTNNYHQVRICGVLAGIESLALIGNISSFKGLGFNMATADIAASGASVFSSLFDLMYTFTKSARELPEYAAIDGIYKGADIVRGGFKLAAGLFAAFAGVVTMFSDWDKATKEKDSFRQAILYSRSGIGALSTISGTLAAYSYSGAFFGHFARKEGRSVLLSALLDAAAIGADKLSKRVLLLRTLAWIGWIGVVITVIDLAYSGYRWYVDYTAITRWLNRCVFRKVKTNKNFSTIKEELAEFHKAQYPEQEGAKQEKLEAT